jgi:hypothetical protein
VKIVCSLTKGNLILARLMTNNCDCFFREHPNAYLREITEKFGTTLQAGFYASKRLKISLKKRPLTTRREMRQKEKNS